MIADYRMRTCLEEILVLMEKNYEAWDDNLLGT